MCENHVSLLNVHGDAYYKYSSSLKYTSEIIFELSVDKSHEAPLQNARVCFSTIFDPGEFQRSLIG